MDVESRPGCLVVLAENFGAVRRREGLFESRNLSKLFDLLAPLLTLPFRRGSLNKMSKALYSYKAEKASQQSFLSYQLLIAIVFYCRSVEVPDNASVTSSTTFSPAFIS